MSEHMKPWEHCAKKWYSINVKLAMENIESGSIVKCILAGKEYSFNIPDEESPAITVEMIKKGFWFVYTWAD